MGRNASAARVLPLGIVACCRRPEGSSTKTISVSVILPSYNERDNLLALIPRIRAVFRPLSAVRPEIIVVDDNSPDGTARAVRKRFGRRLRIIIRKREKGLATAILAGIRHSHGSVVIGMDADGNHDPSVIPEMLAALSRADAVIASRFVAGGSMQEPMRYIASNIANRLFRMILGTQVRDLTSGYYAVKTDALARIDPVRVYRGYGEYHLRLAYFLCRAGFRVTEVPVRYETRAYGQSKSPLLIMAITYLVTALRLRMTPHT